LDKHQQGDLCQQNVGTSISTIEETKFDRKGEQKWLRYGQEGQTSTNTRTEVNVNKMYGNLRTVLYFITPNFFYLIASVIVFKSESYLLLIEKTLFLSKSVKRSVACTHFKKIIF